MGERDPFVVIVGTMIAITGMVGAFVIIVGGFMLVSSCVDSAPGVAKQESRLVTIVKKEHIPHKPRFTEKWKVLVKDDDENRWLLYVSEKTYMEAELGNAAHLNAWVGPMYGWHRPLIGQSAWLTFDAEEAVR